MAKRYHSYLQQIGTSEESIAQIDKLYDLKIRAERQNRTIFSEFVNPEIVYLSRKLWIDSAVFSVFGGYQGAEYQILAFNAFDIRENDYPLKLLKVSYPSKFATISHRDVLGSLMSLGLKRSAFGDIKVKNEYVYFFVLSDFSEYVSQHLSKIKNLGVKIKEVELSEYPSSGDDLKVCNLTVSSLRIDVILAGAFNLSRNKASSQILSGLVKHNYMLTKNNNIILNEGDMLSFRGKGRFYLTEISGKSKKGKIRLKGKITK